jgi:hypothetical protein
MSGDFRSPDEDARSSARRFPVEYVHGPIITPGGVLIGRPSIVVRCSVHATPRGVTHILEQCRRCAAPPYLITLMGTECSSENFEPLITAAHEAGYEVGLVTDGARWPEWYATLNFLGLRPLDPDEPADSDHHWRAFRFNLVSMIGRRRAPRIAVTLTVTNEHDLEGVERVRRLVNNMVPLIAQAGTDGDSRAVAVERLAWLASVARARRWYDVRVLPWLTPYLTSQGGADAS